ICLGIGEEVVFLERGDVDLGERGQLFPGELALLLRLDALGREYREHVVEGPGVAHAGHRSVGPVDDLALDGHPDVGTRGRGGRYDGPRKAPQSTEKTTMHHRFARQGPPACSPNPPRAGAQDITDSAAERRRKMAPGT